MWTELYGNNFSYACKDFAVVRTWLVVELHLIAAVWIWRLSQCRDASDTYHIKITFAEFLLSVCISWPLIVLLEENFSPCDEDMGSICRTLVICLIGSTAPCERLWYPVETTKLSSLFTLGMAMNDHFIQGFPWPH